MRKIVPLITLAAVVLLTGWGLVSTLTGPGGLLENDTDRYTRQARAALAVDRAQADLAAYRAAVDRADAQADALAALEINRAAAFTYAGTVAGVLLVLLVPCAVVLALLITVDAYLHRRAPLVPVAADGTVPMSRAWVVGPGARPLQVAALQGLHQTRQIAAAHPPQPQHYAPHITYQNRQEGGPLLPPGDDPALAAAPVPALGASIRAGLFSTPGRYLLAHALDTGAPIWADPDAARSLLAGGQGRSGKSTALAGQALQEIVVPAPGLREPPVFLLLDPHHNKPSSLTKRLEGLGPRIHMIAHTPADVLKACEYYEREGKRRISTGRAAYRLVLLGDEMSLMYEDGSGYEDARAAISAAFLHSNIHYGAVHAPALAGVHLLPAAAFGGRANLRRSFHARAAFRLDAADGQMLGLAPAMARELITLAAGQCMLMAPGLPVTRAVAPNVEPDAPALALEYATWMHAGRTSSTPARPPARPAIDVPGPYQPRTSDVLAEAPGDGDGTPPAPARTLDGTAWDAVGTAGTVPPDMDAAAVINLFYGEGLDVAAIMRRLYPDLQGKGKTLNDWQARVRAINAIIRQTGRGQAA